MGADESTGKKIGCDCCQQSLCALVSPPEVGTPKGWSQTVGYPWSVYMNMAATSTPGQNQTCNQWGRALWFGTILHSHPSFQNRF